jgi:hypothetical protein
VLDQKQCERIDLHLQRELPTDNVGVLGPPIALLSLPGVSLMSAVFFEFLLNRNDLPVVRAVTDLPVGDCVASLVTEGVVERSGSVYNTF